MPFEARRDPARRRNRSSRRSRNSGALIEIVRAAANSIASGMPSSRRQISRTTSTELGDSTSKSGTAAGSLHEQRHRLVAAAVPSPQRRHRPEPFVGHRSPSGSSPGSSPPRTIQDRLDQLGRRVEHVLTVVEHHNDGDPPTPRRYSPSSRGPAAARAPPPSPPRRYRVRVAHRRQLDQPHPIGELGDRVGGNLHRESRLADSADAGQGHQSRLPQRIGHRHELRVSPHERGALRGQIGHERIE